MTGIIAKNGQKSTKKAIEYGSKNEYDTRWLFRSRNLTEETDALMASFTHSSAMDMTRGEPTRLLLRFMIPLVIGNVFQQVYSMVDTMIVGRTLGADALAAVGATGSLNFLFFSLCNGLASGIGILVAQAFGAARPDTVRKLITNAVYIMTAAALIMGGAGYALSGAVLKWLGTPENILERATTYMQVCCVGILSVSMYNCIAAILRGIGDSRTPLIFLIISSFLNVGLDFFFILKLGMGVGGAALATIIAQTLSAAGSLIYAVRNNPLFRMERRLWRPDRALILGCCRIGLPLAAQSSMIALSLVILQSVVNGFGSAVGAAFTATSRIEVLVQQPYNSLFAALSTFTGQNIGAGQMDRVRKGFRKAAGIMLLFTAAMTPLMQFFGGQIVGWFVDAQAAPAVIGYGARGLRITSLFFAPLGMIGVCRGVLNGAGDGTYSVISGSCEMVGRIVFPHFLTRIPAVGMWGIWLGTALTWLLVAGASYIRYRRGAWQHKGQMKREEAYTPGLQSGGSACRAAAAGE